MKKIMFSDKFGLTQAVLDGRKTQTRRIVPQKDLTKACEFAITYFNETFDVFADDKEVLQHYFFVEKIGKIPYKPGEVIAVAQSYKDCGNMPDCELDKDGYPIMPKRSGFFNKLFVRADLMPHRIRITNVRVERLQDISDEDCAHPRKVENNGGESGICIWRDCPANCPDFAPKTEKKD